VMCAPPQRSPAQSLRVAANQNALEGHDPTPHQKKKGAGPRRELVTFFSDRSSVVSDQRCRTRGRLVWGSIRSPRRRLTFPFPSRTRLRPRVKDGGRGQLNLVAASGGRNRTARSARGGAGRGSRGTAARGGAAAVVVLLARTELAHPVAHREALLLGLATASRLRAAGRGRSGTDRSTSDGSGAGRGTRGGSGTSRGTSRGSGTGRGTRGRGGTRRGGSAAARLSATAVVVLAAAEQAGVGAVQAGETHQRGGDQCVLHLKTPRHPGGKGT